MKATHFILAVICVFILPGTVFSTEMNRSIGLTEAIETALSNNLNLKLQKEDVNSASGGILRSKGDFDIMLMAELAAQSEESTPLYSGAAEQEDATSLSAELSKTFTTGTAISLGWSNSSYDSDTVGLEINPSYNSGLTLGLSQPLLKGFGEKIQTSGIQASEQRYRAATKELDSTTANLVADVKKAYWSLVYSYQNIEVQKLSLKLANKLLEETEAQINAGKLAPVEIYQPQSEVARREEQLISAERAFGVAEDNLKILINSEDWLISFTPVDAPPTEPVTLDVAQIVTNALQNRPDIQAVDLQTKIAEIELTKSKDNKRPDLSVFGSIGLGGTDESFGESFEDTYNDPNNEWKIGVSYSMPLENSLAEGAHQQAMANYNKAKTNGELLRQQTKKEVRTTVRDVQLAIKALEATQKTSLATLKRLEAEQAKFDSGRSTTLDVLIAQEAYAQALSQENLTKISYANSLAELDRIQGLVSYNSMQK